MLVNALLGKKLCLRNKKPAEGDSAGFFKKTNNMKKIFYFNTFLPFRRAFRRAWQGLFLCHLYFRR